MINEGSKKKPSKSVDIPENARHKCHVQKGSDRGKTDIKTLVAQQIDHSFEKRKETGGMLNRKAARPRLA